MEGGNGIGLMKRYTIKMAREEFFRFFSQSASENESIDKALNFLSGIEERDKYALDVSEIALHLILKSAFDSRLYEKLKRRMSRYNNIDVRAVLSVIREHERVGRKALKA